MSRGYPDYFGFSTFPWVGKIITDTDLKNIAAGSNGSVAELLGKRYVLNVKFAMDGAESHGADTIVLLIDGVSGLSIKLRDLKDHDYHYIVPTFPIGLFISEVTFKYRGFFMGGFTTAEKLEVWYYNASGESLNILTNILTSVIQ